MPGYVTLSSVPRQEYVIRNNSFTMTHFDRETSGTDEGGAIDEAYKAHHEKLEEESTHSEQGSEEPLPEEEGGESVI